MPITQARILSTNSILKISSVIIAFFLWSILNQSRPAQMTVMVPICFYNDTEQYTLTVPEHCCVILHGLRSQVRALDAQSLAIHIDASILHEGLNTVSLEPHHLLLPSYLYLASSQQIHILCEPKAS
jgi:hypothetical protein